MSGLWARPNPRDDKPYTGKGTPSPKQWRAILEARRAAVAEVRKGLNCPACLPVMLDGCASHGLDCPNMGASWRTTGEPGQRLTEPGGAVIRDDYGRLTNESNPPAKPPTPKAASQRGDAHQAPGFPHARVSE
jgi:hypothetical protein